MEGLPSSIETAPSSLTHGSSLPSPMVSTHLFQPGGTVMSWLWPLMYFPKWPVLYPAACRRVAIVLWFNPRGEARNLSHVAFTSTPWVFTERPVSRETLAGPHTERQRVPLQS